MRVRVTALPEKEAGLSELLNEVGRPPPTRNTRRRTSAREERQRSDRRPAREDSQAGTGTGTGRVFPSPLDFRRESSSALLKPQRRD